MNFIEFLKSQTNAFTPVVASGIQKSDYQLLDLSVSNSQLNSIDISSATEMEVYIQSLLQKHSKKIAWGGYLEQRAIYQRSSHFNPKNSENERNIHLGIDLWIASGAEVLSVLDGEIHSFKNNDQFGDYGPTIILKHHINNQPFYTLYGHLSRESLHTIKIGQKIEKGEVIGKLGLPEENGDYAPHLHFQVIKDLGNYIGDYPGVCSKQDLEFYSENCPDPNLLLKIHP